MRVITRLTMCNTYTCTSICMHIYVGNKTQYKRSCRVFQIYMYRPIYLIRTIIRS